MFQSRANSYRSKKTNPGQHNLKPIIDRDTFFLYGLILDKSGKQIDQPLAVAAYSDRFRPHELVDVTIFPVISGLIIAGIYGVVIGLFPASKIISSSIIGMSLIVLMGFSYFNSRDL